METEMETEMDLEKGFEKQISEEIQGWLDEKKKEQNDSDDQPLQTIFDVPDDIDGASFQKRIEIGIRNVSYQLLGTGLHNDVKVWYMFYLFERLKSPPDDMINECVHRVQSKFDQIIACYEYYMGRDFTSDHESKLIMIMVTDACYILSLIHKWSLYVKPNGSSYSDSFMVKHQTKRDLIVLDNQIPFFVLQDIFECTILKHDPTASLIKLILSFVKDINPFEANSITGHHGTHGTDYKYILDLLYKTYQPPDAHSSGRLSTVTTTYSAVELRKAGVKFKPYQGDKWKMAIKFNSSWSNTTLTMPAMRIEESTVPLLWNLTAYERCFPEVGNYIASYSFAMMMLVDTKEDLLELVESKVIRYPSGHQYIMDTIHELCKGVVLKDFSFAKEWQKMDNYCNSRLGYTRRTYFSGAWSYIASVSALVLFILTAIQTYCSIRAL